MKKTIVLLFCFSLIMVHGFSQSETRETGPFEKISMGIAGDLYLTQGNKIDLRLEGDEDDLNDIITEVRGSTLSIRYRGSGWHIRRDRVTVYLTAPEISGISLGGSGKIIGEGMIRAEDMDIQLSGSGRISLELQAEDLTTSISGSGRMSLAGKVDDVDLSISGSGDLEAEELEAESYSVRISGSGKCRIWVAESLDSRISGSGSVYYKGDPQKINSNTSGSGRVRKL